MADETLLSRQLIRLSNDDRRIHTVRGTVLIPWAEQDPVDGHMYFVVEKAVHNDLEYSFLPHMKKNDTLGWIGHMVVVDFQQTVSNPKVFKFKDAAAISTSFSWIRFMPKHMREEGNREREEAAMEQKKQLMEILKDDSFGSK